MYVSTIVTTVDKCTLYYVRLIQEETRHPGTVY